MRSLGEDWFAVGEVYFRFLHLFDVSWGAGFSFSHIKLAVGQNSGYVVFLSEGQLGSKPMLYIFTAAGKLVTQKPWKDAPPLHVGWSVSEEILVVQKCGFVSVLDLSGKYIRRFSMGPEAEKREILDVRFFNLDNNTGVAVLTGGEHIFITSNIDSPRVFRLADVFTIDQPISLWEIVTGTFDSGTTRVGQHAEMFRAPWALIVRKNLIFRADFNRIESVQIPVHNQLDFTEILLISVAYDAKFVALYLNNGTLLITNLRMSEVHLQVDLTRRVSVMLSPTNDLSNPSAAAKLNHPKAMLWLTNSAVVLKSDNLIVLVGAQADIYESFIPEDIWMTGEEDSVRILTPTSHKLLQRVPPALEALGRIGASCPATWLVSASNSLKAESGRTNDYLLPIRNSRQMIEAISHCLEAASHALLDTKCQHELLEAAHMGRIFLVAMFTDSKDQLSDNEVKNLGVRAANVCRILRLLNNLATPWIGIALTWTQFQKIGPKRLLERLLVRGQYPMALEFARNMPEEKHPTTTSNASTSVSHINGLTRVLAHWACHSLVAESENPAFIADRLDRIINKIRNIDSGQSLKDTAGDVKKKSFVVAAGSSCAVDFAYVADQALLVKREKVAELLIEYEARAWQQVPLLIKLGSYNRALVRAVESGDPELITLAIAALQDQAKLPPADLAMVLRRYPIAMAVYHETWGNFGTLYSGDVRSGSSSSSVGDLPRFESDDRTADAKKCVLSAFKETNLQLRLYALQRAEEIYKQLKNEFMAQECNASSRLLSFQGKLEKQEISAPVFEKDRSSEDKADDLNRIPLILPVAKPSGPEEKLWVGQSLHMTLMRLLAVPQGERFANQLRREFHVSEKRYAYLRLITSIFQNDSLQEVEKLSKTKKPLVSVETLIKACIDCNHFEEAQRLVPRLPAERRVRFWLLCGQVEDAIRAAVSEKSDFDLCLILDKVGRGNSTLHERITALRQAIR